MSYTKYTRHTPTRLRTLSTSSILRIRSIRLVCVVRGAYARYASYERYDPGVPAVTTIPLLGELSTAREVGSSTARRRRVYGQYTSRTCEVLRHALATPLLDHPQTSQAQRRTNVVHGDLAHHCEVAHRYFGIHLLNITTNHNMPRRARNCAYSEAEIQ